MTVCGPCLCRSSRSGNLPSFKRGNQRIFRVPRSCYKIIRNPGALHKLNGLDPELYLRTVLGQFADHPIKRIGELLPWNLAATLQSTSQAA